MRRKVVLRQPRRPPVPAPGRWPRAGPPADGDSRHIRRLQCSAPVISGTVDAPEAMAASTVRSVTALQWQTYIALPSGARAVGAVADPPRDRWDARCNQRGRHRQRDRASRREPVPHADGFSAQVWCSTTSRTQSTRRRPVAAGTPGDHVTTPVLPRRRPWRSGFLRSPSASTSGLPSVESMVSLNIRRP